MKKYAIYFPATDSTPAGSYLMDRSGKLSNDNTPEDQYLTFKSEDEAILFLDERPEWVRAEIVESE